MKYDWTNYVTLIAEDDPLNYKYMQLLLERRTGISILWAKDGLEAIELARKYSNIDIVLLDLQLPHVDGIKVLKTVKSFNPYIPVIIQTANSWNNEEEICTEAGCDGFFTKPINMDGLLARMDYCLTAQQIINKAPAIGK